MQKKHFGLWVTILWVLFFGYGRGEDVWTGEWHAQKMVLSVSGTTLAVSPAILGIETETLSMMGDGTYHVRRAYLTESLEAAQILEAGFWHVSEIGDVILEDQNGEISSLYLDTAGYLEPAYPGSLVRMFSSGDRTVYTREAAAVGETISLTMAFREEFAGKYHATGYLRGHTYIPLSQARMMAELTVTASSAELMTCLTDADQTRESRLSRISTGQDGWHFQDGSQILALVGGKTLYLFPSGEEGLFLERQADTLSIPDALCQAGKSAQVIALDENGAAVQGVWEVSDSDVTISEEGVISVAEDLKEGRTVLVTVRTSDGRLGCGHVRICPKVRRLAISPEEVVAYLGQTETVTLTAQTQPANAYLDGNSWKIGEQTMFDVLESEADTLILRPCKAGKTEILLSCDGKQAKASITVLLPVESVSISGSDTVRAGSAATYRANVLPKNAGNQKVQWSVNVSSDIASISSSGYLTVKKGVPGGTLIEVTCTAIGTEKQVSAVKTVTVKR
ncbi:MAG: hypothetical protein IJ246_02255 [Clostridia bacterium]|nr:hypothetical protein [Clostridia bacterium]